MVRLVKSLRRSRRNAGLAQVMDYCLHRRKVLRVEPTPDLDCDGLIRPLGSDFSGGFQMLINSRCTRGRYRFTVAHELCHTFFYELVPEMKFQAHSTDGHEERICNLGAAELLMPRVDVIKIARRLNTSMDSLERLASTYEVSIEAMLLRLRFLRLWESELTVWHRMSGGRFSLRRIIGGRKREWVWDDTSIPQEVWESGRKSSGRTYVRYVSAEGGNLFKAVSFEVVRRGMSLVALWSRPLTPPNDPVPPLFA